MHYMYMVQESAVLAKFNNYTVITRGTYCNYGIIDVDTGLPRIVEGNFNHQLCRNDIIMM